MKLAIIETGGKQYAIGEGATIMIERLPNTEGEHVTFDRVLLLVDGDAIQIGNPYIAGATVEAEVTKQGRGRKIRILRYHSKTRTRRRKGHRQHYTQVKIK